jgi:glycosyltransferase involved in cell wall biosynthesis
MIHNRDILVVGQQAWDIEIGSNCKNVALEFSKHNRVLYVNPPLDRITLMRQKNDEKVRKRLSVINKQKDGLEKVSNNLWNLYPDRLWESINWIKIDLIYNALNKWNNRVFAKSIKKALKKLHFQNTIIFNDGDMFRSFYLKELLQPDLTIYYLRDNFVATDYYKHHGKKIEPRLIEKSDLCLANSDYLVNYCKKYNKNVYNVGQGCDLEMFENANQYSIPNDMAALKKPIIGYVGVLFNTRLDINILSHIALNNPDWNIVLIGPEDDGFVNSKLHQLPNVHFLGLKEPSELPAYISSFDVCINPQLVNELTIGNYPRKVDEYLAMGKPVVATKTLAMKMFDSYTYTTDRKEEYPPLIEKALSEDSLQLRQDRIRFATGHTWKNHIQAIYDAMVKTLHIRYAARTKVYTGNKLQNWLKTVQNTQF